MANTAITWAMAQTDWLLRRSADRCLVRNSGEAARRRRSAYHSQEAKQFVDATNVDALAPAVGNMHGLLQSMVEDKSEKRLNIKRIAEIKAATAIFVTLDGGSGTCNEDFQQAIKALYDDSPC